MMSRSINLQTFAGAVLLALILGLAGGARADVIAWNEAVNGEFSKNGLAPTSVTFVTGTGNDVLGTDGKVVATDPRLPDYFTFTVPNGSALTAIIVLPGTTTAGPLGLSFIGIEAGNQITLPLGPPDGDATGLLGWRHFSPADIGQDILPAMGTSDFGATGFVPPLGPGNYAIWVMETGVCGPSLCHYGLDFVLAPEPASGAIVLSGLALLTALRRSRRRYRGALPDRRECER
jgi:hypothetical protein